jgi:CSLREA domain-containing protein
LTLREAVLVVDGSLGRSLTAGEQAQVSGTLGTNDTIQFSLPSGAQTITLTSGPLDITRSVAVNGPGAGNLTISGNNLDRVFIVGQIWSVNLSEVVTINGLTVAGGNQVYGGGLLNFGSLTVSSCVFSGNSAGSSGGGGIYNVGSLTMTGSTFSGNTVSQLGAGGALDNISSGNATVSNCTFTGNTATGSGSTASSGAAIANSGTLQLTGCTLTGNTAASNGGGVFSNGTLTVTGCSILNNSCGSDGAGIDQDGTATVTNTTLAGNTSASEGGGLGNKGTLTMSDCTVYGNAATSDGGGIATSGSAQFINCTITANRVTSGASSVYGGGIFAQSVAPKLFNTVVAGNFQGAAPSTTANDIAGTIDSSSTANLIGTGGSGGLVNGTNGNQVGVANPGLAALASNGGPTQTVALLAGSAAIGHGNNAYVAAGATDQRGLTRTVNGSVDIGAVESQLTSTAPSDQSATQGSSSSLSLGSFADANAAAGPWSVDVNWGDSTSHGTMTTSSQGSLGSMSHTYASSGTFTVAVTVTDANHDASQASFQVTVAGGQPGITVNSTVDNTTADNVLTLREAILYVDGALGRSLTPGEQAQFVGPLGSNPTIRFGLPSGPQTITLTGGALSLTASATISGPGAANLTINGNGQDRVIVVGQIWSRNVSQVATISGLTLTNGKQTYGAGLLNFGTLTLNNVVVSNNVAGTSGGGGIYNVGALTVNNSTITGNSCGANTSGGGIYNISSGVLSASGSTFTNNVAGGTGSSGSSGGAVYNSGTSTFTGCTFNANSAGSDAGALFTDNVATAISCSFTNNTSGADGGALHSAATFTMTNCLVAGNTASSSGGGMEESSISGGVNTSHTSVSGTTTITNTTFANNLAYGTAGGLVNWASNVTLVNDTFTGNRSGSGGGLWCPTSLTLQNSIVAGNSQVSGTTPNDIAGTLSSGSSYNLIGTGGSGGLTNGSNHNKVGIANPGLGVLGNNGGPTQTIALLPGSPALGAGNNALVASGATDQRGFSRIVNGTVDIGAFEVQTTVAPPANQTASVGVAATISLGSFTDASSAGPWTITINWGDSSTASTVSTTNQGSLGTRTHTYTQKGTYNVTVTVKDANNDTTTATFVVVVS